MTRTTCLVWDRHVHRDEQVQRGWLLIGAAIKRRRLWLHWTQRHLELVSGIDQTVISRIENGKQFGLRWSKLALLIAALGGLDVPTDPDVRARMRQRGDPTIPLERVDLTGGIFPDPSQQPDW